MLFLFSLVIENDIRWLIVFVCWVRDDILLMVQKYQVIRCIFLLNYDLIIWTFYGIYIENTINDRIIFIWLVIKKTSIILFKSSIVSVKLLISSPNSLILFFNRLFSSLNLTVFVSSKAFVLFSSALAWFCLFSWKASRYLEIKI